MTVRTATPAEHAAVRTLQGLLDHPAPKLLEAALEGRVGKVLVATDASGGVVGYALVVPGPDRWYLAELTVAPAARREGHATRLVTAIAARGSGRLRVTVAADDHRARRFYEALGFETCERLREWFEDRDGLLLCRSA